MRQRVPALAGRTPALWPHGDRGAAHHSYSYVTRGLTTHQLNGAYSRADAHTPTSPITGRAGLLKGRASEFVRFTGATAGLQAPDATLRFRRGTMPTDESLYGARDETSRCCDTFCSWRLVLAASFLSRFMGPKARSRARTLARCDAVYVTEATQLGIRRLHCGGPSVSQQLAPSCMIMMCVAIGALVKRKTL